MTRGVAGAAGVAGGGVGVARGATGVARGAEGVARGAEGIGGGIGTTILKFVQTGSPEVSMRGNGTLTSGLSPSKSFMSGPRCTLQ